MNYRWVYPWLGIRRIKVRPCTTSWLCCAKTKKEFDGPAAERSRRYQIGAHHVVGFVLQDVAMPEILAGISAERNNNPRHCSGRTLHDVFPSHFMRGRMHHRACEAEFCFGQIIVGREIL